MMFEEQKQLDVISCPSCKGTGLVGIHKCKQCGGSSLCLWRRNKLLIWDYPFTRYNLALLNARRIWNKIRRITLIVLWLNSWVWFLFLIYKSGSAINFISSPEMWPAAFSALDGQYKILFWFGVLFLCALWYRTIVEKKKAGEVEKFDYKNKDIEESRGSGPSDWAMLKNVKNNQKILINKTYTDEAMSALSEAYRFADKNNHAMVVPEHVFYALLSFNRIANIFVRLGIPAKELKDNLGTMLGSAAATQNSASMPLLSASAQQILFTAYDEAYQAHQDYVSVTELLVSVIKQSPMLQELLYDLEVEKDKLLNVVEWARIRERLYRQYVKLSRAASHRSKTGMDKAMTALATPYLNSFSEDMTLKSQLGHYDYCAAREKEYEEMFRVIDGGSMNIVLVGPHGVGKRTIIEGLAEKMVEDDVPARIQDKRLVKLSIASLLAGTTPSGAIERLIGIMNEISRARNVILFIHNIHELVGVSAGEGGSLDVADTLAEYLKGGNFLTISTTTDEEYAQHIADSTLSNVFTKIDVKEMDENQAIQVVESKIGALEHKNQVFFAYSAVEKTVQLSARYLHEIYLPGSALEVASEAASFTRSKKGSDTLVTAEEVAAVVADKTGIPVTSVTSDESSKLLKLEEEMHNRVIGQEEAVDLVANALRRARVEIRSKKRPIANFLFLGPTGVGKTELAKTIAQVYFGGEDRMTRLDMSEYQDKSGVYRLIGAPGEKGTGILTEAIRRHPFTLLLLDEIEKADPDILNLFLQVMDDGRLTDSTGRVVDFTNAIMIATSNAGTSYVQEQLKAGISSEAIKDRLLHGELKQYFRPEFLNRFDGIVLFKALNIEDIKKIAAIMIDRIRKDLEAKGIELIIEDAALDFLASVGFDPDFGARPMRRALQERVENKLAELLLSGKVHRRDKIVFGEGGSLTIV